MAAAAATSASTVTKTAMEALGEATLVKGPYLVFGGKTGWIGQKMVALLTELGCEAIAASSRLDNREDVALEVDTVKPAFVLNCAGVTGRPNVDWCEDHKAETIRTNVIGTMSLLDICESRGIHVTNFATGCIYRYDDAHAVGSGVGFTEEDTPNFTGSFYSLTKGMVETMSRAYSNVLTLRFRMPISDDLNHRNFVTKITKYARVVNIPNSMTTLFDMLPVAALMAHRKLTGVYNFTNPGAISHNQILELYRKHVDPTFWWANFTEEQCNAILKAERSNNELDTSKLEGSMPDIRIPPIVEAADGVFERMAVNLKEAGSYPPVNFKDAEGIAKPADAV